MLWTRACSKACDSSQLRHDCSGGATATCCHARPGLRNLHVGRHGTHSAARLPLTNCCHMAVGLPCCRYSCPHCKSRQQIQLTAQQETSLRIQAKQILSAAAQQQQQQQQRESAAAAAQQQRQAAAAQLAAYTQALAAAAAAGAAPRPQAQAVRMQGR